MARSDRTYRSHRDDSASLTRIVLSLLGVVVGVGLVGLAVFVLAGKLAGPAPNLSSDTASSMKPSIEPSIAPTVSTYATPSVESSSASMTAIATPQIAARAPVAEVAAKPTAPAKSSEFVVVVDAGHQGKGDSSPEPIGPGASETKPAVASGTSGVATKRDESIVNLEISLKIQKELESRGIKVIMVRTKQDVNISNAERAEIANKAKADLLLRIHCDSAGSSVRGLLTMVPGKNKWTGPIVEPSAKAGKAIHTATLKTTGAKNRGIVSTSQMSGFNWSKVPAVIVETGLMSNAAEDRLLSSDSYQKKLAEGISNGVESYLKSTR